MLENVYYQLDDKTYYLKLDGVFRLIPNNQTFKNLYAQDFNSNLIPPSNQFPNQSKAPFSKGNPLMNGAGVYRIPNDQSQYFSDNYVWDLQKVVFRKIVNKSQFVKLGFVNTGSQWNGAVPEIAVPLAINTGRNMELQTKVSGGYLVYHYLCYRGTLNKYFTSWASNGKQAIKTMIIESQTAIDKLKGVVSVATPTFNPMYVSPSDINIVVNISCSTPSTVIYYTTDGSAPVPGIASVYRNGVSLNVKSTNKVLKAVAEAVDSPGVSSVFSVDYVPGRFPVSAPSPSVAPGNSRLNQISVNLYCATQNVTIYYTTNGLTPTKTDSVYDGTPIALDLRTANKTLKAFAFSNQYQTSSPIMSAEYRFVPAQMMPPCFSLYGNASFVIPNYNLSMYPGESDSFIRYTTVTNGAPSTLYQIPVNINMGRAPNRTVTVAAQSTGTYGQLPSDIVTVTLNCTVPWISNWSLTQDCNDSIGTVNLTNQNVVFNSNYMGNYAYFNGSALLSTTNVATMQSPTFTISAYAAVEQISNPDNYVPIVTFEKSDNGHDGPGIVIFSNGFVQGQTIQADGTYKIIKGQAYPYSAPMLSHYALTADGKNLTLYVNGRSIGSVAYNGTINTSYCQRLCIGGEQTSSNSSIMHPLKGNVRNVCYTNVALTQNQIMDLYMEQYWAS